MLAYEVTQALDQLHQEDADFRIEEAWDAWILYKDLITAPQNRHKFFPYAKASDPILSDPVTSTIINRLASALHKGATYRASINQQDVTDELKKIIQAINYNNIINEVLIKTLATGGQLITIATTPTLKLQAYQPYYAGKAFDEFNNVVAYYTSFTLDNRTMLPAIDSYTKSKPNNFTRIFTPQDIITIKNSEQPEAIPHYLPFIPATWADNIDMDENGQYGVPYSNRFKNLLLNLNATLSQKQKALIFLQNIWVAKTNMAPASDEPELTLTPDTINYVSVDGTLEQAIRNLDLTEESNQIAYLKKAIYKSAQVPQEEDLSSQGKLESGVALRILYSQFEEVLSRLRLNWVEVEKDLLTKVFRANRLLNRKQDPGANLSIEVIYDTNIVPEDEQHRLDIDLRLLDQGLITRESLIRKYNRSDVDIKELLNNDQSGQDSTGMGKTSDTDNSEGLGNPSAIPEGL